MSLKACQEKPTSMGMNENVVYLKIKNACKAMARWLQKRKWYIKGWRYEKSEENMSKT